MKMKIHLVPHVELKCDKYVWRFHHTDVRAQDLKYNRLNGTIRVQIGKQTLLLRFKMRKIRIQSETCSTFILGMLPYVIHGIQWTRNTLERCTYN